MRYTLFCCVFFSLLGYVVFFSGVRAQGVTDAVVCPEKNKGDANCDNRISEEDIMIWQREYEGVDTTTNGDFNNDTFIDLVDFEVWRDASYITAPVLSTPTKTPIPSNCHYQEVQCIKAPCDPVLVCVTEGSTKK